MISALSNLDTLKLILNLFYGHTPGIFMPEHNIKSSYPARQGIYTYTTLNSKPDNFV